MFSWRLVFGALEFIFWLGITMANRQSSMFSPQIHFVMIFLARACLLQMLLRLVAAWHFNRHLVPLGIKPSACSYRLLFLISPWQWQLLSLWKNQCLLLLYMVFCEPETLERHPSVLVCLISCILLFRWYQLCVQVHSYNSPLWSSMDFSSCCWEYLRATGDKSFILEIRDEYVD